MIPGIAANPFQGRPTNPRHLFRARQDGWILGPSDHSTLWIDEARTQNATLPGDVVWWIDDKSPNQNHFGAVSSAARGRLYRWPASAVLEGGPKTTVSANSEFSSLEGGPFSGSLASIVGTQVFAGKRYMRYNNPTEIFTRRGNVQDGDCVESIFWLPQSAGQILRVTRSGAPMTPVSANVYSDGTIVASNGGDRISTQVLLTGEIRISIRTTITGGSGGRNYGWDWRPVGDAGEIWVTGFMNVNGLTNHPYQRVGAGLWDVTEESWPDCWGVAFDGLSTRYRSTRGIPLFAMNRLRAVMGSTKLGIDGIGGGGGNPLSNRISGSSTNNAVGLGMHQASASYNLRYRSNENANIAESLAYPSPHSAVLDVMVNASAANCFVRVNNAAPLTSPTINPGTINGNQWSLGADLNGSSFASFILWGLVMVNEEPNPNKWEQAARQWMSRKMGGILNV